MGLLDWLAPKKTSAVARTEQTPAGAGDSSQPSVTVTMQSAGEVKLAGTTTNSKDAVHALMARHGIRGAGLLDATGTVQREPENTVDSDAVAVLVEGERVGYLDRWARQAVDVGIGAAEIPLRLFSAVTPRGFRVEAWAWIGGGTPTWSYDQYRPPPMTAQEKRLDQHQRSRTMVADAVAEGGIRGAEFKAGMVDGIHYLELVEPIKQLKRDGRLEEALVLAYKAIEATEKGDTGIGLPPFYTEQAAIILRKLGRREEEIALLHRYVDRLPFPQRNGSGLKERLDKLEAAN